MGIEIEDELKRQVVRHLENDFELLNEVEGISLVDQSGVRIDYMALAKPHLIKTGFLAEWFGIEVKQILDFSRGDMGKKSQVIWQAITYSQSAFLVNNARTRPAFVLVYIGDDQFDQTRAPVLRGLSDGEWAKATWRALINIAQYANVGQLRLEPQQGWEIVFSGGRYFSKARGKGNVNIGVKRYVGSV